VRRRKLRDESTAPFDDQHFDEDLYEFQHGDNNIGVIDESDNLVDQDDL
jgi:hypothetical protein